MRRGSAALRLPLSGLEGSPRPQHRASAPLSEN
jgi:hypothetical protein